MKSRFGAVHPETAACFWSLSHCTLHFGENPARGMYGSTAKGTRAPSHHSGLIPQCGTGRPAIQEYPNMRLRPALFCLWELHTTHCLILLRVFGLLSCSGSFSEAVVSQICTLQNRGISTLSSERQSPFSKSLGHRGHEHRARASRKN